MVIDSSAILAILQREPERRRLLEALEGADTVRISVGSSIERAIVIETRFGPDGLRDLDRFFVRAMISSIRM